MTKKNLKTTNQYLFGCLGRSNVPALNVQKNKKLDPNSGNFLVVGLSPGNKRLKIM